ncbi:carbohydrate kinase family protein [Algoriphagus halophytocola]|uniref:Carbohydrate kinase n=1 Tax=Algoriphagus halophytocola TaxID=2991499 RepID=A0ABY6MMP5_9BACT|nr:carbohydrate kinase [Algoriphagus sp. TR-M5]UZD23662.1 carbohydrate kinase [Algoriphagus sp. TR-M5]
MSKKVVIFGEMLWDCLPSGPVPGGAPLNVMLNLTQLGLNAQLISAVGDDEDGENLLQFLKDFPASVELIQVHHNQPTSKVLVDTSDKENMKYTIVSPVAWDFISFNDRLEQATQSAEAFVFGTLSVRNQLSLETLLRLLQHHTLRIFDANLRPPFYDFQVIEKLLHLTDILKINEDELELFAAYFSTDPNPKSLCGYLDKHFPLTIICITMGAKGAAIYQNGQFTHHSGYRVEVEDSIGAGDAFLSGFIYSYLAGKDHEATLDFACKIGALVASRKGGTVSYTLDEIQKIGT